MSLAKIKRNAVPLHAEVTELLRHQIMTEALKAGEKLPAVNELTKEFGVAPMTIRQAMDSLDEAGLIERYAGKGTFVRKVNLPQRQTLNMQAELSQLQAMVSQLEVAVVPQSDATQISDIDGVAFCQMKRIHTLAGEPFCQVDLALEKRIYQMAPERFDAEIAVTVLQDLGITMQSARQTVTLANANVETARVLGLTVNTPVFRVVRKFFSVKGQLIYCATLIYPGDKLELEVEFTV